MSKIFNVAVFVGSLRKDSINRKVANALIDLAPASLKLSIVDISALTLYNQDEDANPPQPWTDLRTQIKAADAVLFVSPEYNRSIPAVMKNVLDIGSRPYGANAWAGKPGGVVTASPGNMGGVSSAHHLRQALVFLNVPAMQQPEVYLSAADKLFDESGKLSNESTSKFLQKFLSAFTDWVATNAKG